MPPFSSQIRDQESCADFLFLVCTSSLFATFSGVNRISYSYPVSNRERASILLYVVCRQCEQEQDERDCRLGLLLRCLNSTIHAPLVCFFPPCVASVDVSTANAICFCHILQRNGTPNKFFFNFALPSTTRAPLLAACILVCLCSHPFVVVCPWWCCCGAGAG